MIFCVLDTETTGLQVGTHEVIQVAAIICDDRLEEIDRLSFKIRPRNIEKASKKALEINGYHPRTWNPDFLDHKKALEYLNAFIESSNPYGDTVIMAGQNVKFDFNFLRSEYERADVYFPFSGDMFDLIQVAKIWSKVTGTKLRKFSLKFLAEFTDQINTKPHDAEADAEVTLDILRWFVEDFKKVSKNDRKRFRKYSSIKV